MCRLLKSFPASRLHGNQRRRFRLFFWVHRGLWGGIIVAGSLTEAGAALMWAFRTAPVTFCRTSLHIHDSTFTWWSSAASLHLQVTALLWLETSASLFYITWFYICEVKLSLTAVRGPDPPADQEVEVTAVICRSDAAGCFWLWTMAESHHWISVRRPRLASGRVCDDRNRYFKVKLWCFSNPIKVGFVLITACYKKLSTFTGETCSGRATTHTFVIKRFSRLSRQQESAVIRTKRWISSDANSVLIVFNNVFRCFIKFSQLLRLINVSYSRLRSLGIKKQSQTINSIFFSCFLSACDFLIHTV